MKTLLTLLILFPLISSAQVKWPTYLSKFNNPIITVTGDGDYIKVGIDGTTSVKWIKKSELPKLNQTITRDTVKTTVTIYKELDVKKSAEYIALNQTLAATIDKLNAANSRVDQLTESNFEVTQRLNQCADIAKKMKAEMLKYPVMMIRIDTSLLKKN